MFNYLDDFIGVSSPSTATSDFQALGDLLTSLGLQESSEKSCSPSPVMICLGVQLDTNNFTLSVSSERLWELETLLHRWLTKRTATKLALQSLVGKLVFVSKCIRQSRVFIARILALLGKLRHDHHHANLTAEFRKDLVWWRRFLREYNGVSMINIAKWTSSDAVFSTDACLAGCGGVCDDQYFHGVFPPFISEQNLDISSLELLTIVVALKLWGARWTGLRITVRCDNEAAVTVVNTGRCRNPFMLPFTSLKSVLCIFRVYRIISRIFSPDGIRAPYQQRHSSYSVFSVSIGKKFPFLMRCSGFTVLSNIGPLLFQAPGSSGVLDGISSTRSAPHIVLELSVT